MVLASFLINSRLSRPSSSEKVFNEPTPIYQETLKKLDIITKDLKIDECQTNLDSMLSQLFFFHRFYFFCRGHSLTNLTFYNNSF